jgi:hypothetical protein
MYKEYNEKHDAIVSLYYSPKAINPKEGEIVPHGKIVRDVQIYQSGYINDREIFNKVFLSKEFILDLAKQITEIESQEKDLVYSNLPF